MLTSTPSANSGKSLGSGKKPEHPLQTWAQADQDVWTYNFIFFVVRDSHPCVCVFVSNQSMFLRRRLLGVNPFRGCRYYRGSDGVRQQLLWSLQMIMVLISLSMTDWICTLCYEHCLSLESKRLRGGRWSEYRPKLRADILRCCWNCST